MKTYTVNQAAELVHCHPETLREYIRTGKLVASKIGRSYCIRQVRLDEFLQLFEIEQQCKKGKLKTITGATELSTWTSGYQAANALDSLLARKKVVRGENK